MAETIGLASGLITLSTFALQSSVVLYDAVKSFRFHPKRVRDLTEELEALSGLLRTLTSTVNATADGALSALELPLLGCGNACKGFQEELLKCSSQSSTDRTSFRGWAKLRYMGDDIDGFRQLLAGYKFTISIALTDTALRHSSATAESLEPYRELIKTATDDLEAQRRGIHDKIEMAISRTVTESASDSKELSRIKDERLSTEKCLQICAQLSDHIDLIQLRPSQQDGSSLEARAGRVISGALQQCRDSLHQISAQLELFDLIDRLTRERLESVVLDGDAGKRSRLQEDIEASTPCLELCKSASTKVSNQKIHTIGEATTDGDSEFDGSDNCSLVDDDMFDTSSVMSVETAITSLSGYNNMAQDATMTFVGLLYEVLAWCAIARLREADQTLDIDRLRQGIRRLVKVLSKSLSEELPEMVRRDVSAFFMAGSRPISSAILNRAGLSVGFEMQKLNAKGTLGPAEILDASRRKPLGEGNTEKDAIDDISDAGVEDSDAETEEQEAIINLATLRDVVSASAAFKSFIANLEDLICPTFEAKLKKMSQVVKQRAEHLDPDGKLMGVLSELLYAKPLVISLLETDKYSWVDKSKGYVETVTGQPWDWWPLSPKRTTLDSENSRLSWQCICGETRTGDVQKSHAEYILKARQETINESTSKNKSQNTGDGTQAPGPSSSVEGINSSGSKPDATVDQSGAGHSSSSKHPYIPRRSSILAKPQLAPPLDQAPPSRFIPVMVSSATLALNEIESQSLCNETLFDEIRNAYNGTKGRKRWFSTMKFSHCEFYKFEEWAMKRYCERGAGIPPQEDASYYYFPRPMDREPPISSHEFHDRFYRKISNEDCLFGVPLSSCNDRDAVDRIPQINKQVSVPEKRQQFYGIVTREKKSGLMMMAYIMFCSIPGMVFFFLWIFRWGHDSLQDASILLVLSWTLLGLLYAAQFL